MNYKEQLKATFMHALEFFLIVLFALVISHLFKLSPEDTVAVGGTLLAAFTKYARVSEKIPVKDYVNGEQKPVNNPVIPSEK